MDSVYGNYNTPTIDFSGEVHNRSTYCKKILAENNYDEKAGPAVCKAVYKKVIKQLKETIRSQYGDFVIGEIDSKTGKATKNSQRYTSIKRQFEILTSTGRTGNMTSKHKKTVNYSREHHNLTASSNNKADVESDLSSDNNDRLKLLTLLEEHEMQIKKLTSENKRLSRELAKYSIICDDLKTKRESVQFKKNNFERKNIDTVSIRSHEYKSGVHLIKVHTEPTDVYEDIKI